MLYEFNKQLFNKMTDKEKFEIEFNIELKRAIDADYLSKNKNKSKCIITALRTVLERYNVERKQ